MLSVTQAVNDNREADYEVISTFNQLLFSDKYDGPDGSAT
jgi:hypothetical protein